MYNITPIHVCMCVRLTYSVEKCLREVPVIHQQCKNQTTGNRTKLIHVIIFRTLTLFSSGNALVLSERLTTFAISYSYRQNALQFQKIFENTSIKVAKKVTESFQKG